jgi:L-lactate dehydrogenase complex protein LldG
VETALMSRDHVLHKVRTALGRTVGQAAPPLPEPRLQIPHVDLETRIAEFLGALEALGAKTCRAPTGAHARAYVEGVLNGRSAVASNAPLLRECGITDLPGVESGFTSEADVRQACESAAAGITSADYALSDTGTLVMLSSVEEARLISLVPPVHMAVVPKERLLTGLDELFSLLSLPADRTSSMVLITGPSRTADIEQILVRGVHGPGEIHVVVIG